MRAGDAFDRGQWRALVGAALRHHLRRSGRSLGLAGGNRAGGLVTLALVQLLVGTVLSLPLWGGAPVFPIAALHFTYLMLSVAAMLLLDSDLLVTSPADSDLVAPRPVSDRTAFLARTSTLLAFVLGVAAAQGLLPAVAYFAAGGWHPLRGVLGVVALLSVTLTTAAAVVALYALVLRRVSPAYLRTALTVLQLVTSFALYVLLVLLPGTLGRAYLLDPLAQQPGWLWAVPSTWAARLLGPPAPPWWAAPLALGLPTAAWWLAARWLAVDHATATMADAARTPAPVRRVSPWFRSGETRAVALLVRAQFRHDMRFRLGVLAIVPLTIVYLLLGVVDEGLARSANGHPLMVYIAVMMFPLLLKGVFARSDSYPAAWVFYASPVSAGRLLLGQRTVLVTWFLAPYLGAIGLLLAYMLPASEALLAVLVVALVTHALLLVGFLVDPTLPFSSPPHVAGNTRNIAVTVIPVLVVGQALPAALGYLGADARRAAAALILLAALNVVLHRWLRRRVDRLAAVAEFP